MLGELLLDVLQLFGEDFDIGREGFSVRGGGFRFCVHDQPPHPQAGDPIVIEVRAMIDSARQTFFPCGTPTNSASRTALYELLHCQWSSLSYYSVSRHLRLTPLRLDAHMVPIW